MMWLCLFLTSLLFANEQIDSEYCLESIRKISINKNFDRRCQKVLTKDKRFKKLTHKEGEVFYYQDIILKVDKANALKVLAGDKTKLSNIRRVAIDGGLSNLFVYNCEATCEILRFPFNRNGNIVPYTLLEKENFLPTSKWRFYSDNKVIIINNNIGEFYSLKEDSRRNKKLQATSSFEIPENCHSLSFSKEVLSCEDSKFSYKISMEDNKLLSKEKLSE